MRYVGIWDSKSWLWSDAVWDVGDVICCLSYQWIVDTDDIDFISFFQLRKLKAAKDYYFKIVIVKILTIRLLARFPKILRYRMWT